MKASSGKILLVAVVADEDTVVRMEGDRWESGGGANFGLRELGTGRAGGFFFGRVGILLAWLWWKEEAAGMLGRVLEKD